MVANQGSFSFPKSARLLKNPEFVKVQRLGRRFYSKHFLLVVAREEKIKSPKTKSKVAPVRKFASVRLGITITNKTEPSSVKRNRVKRMVRDAFRHIKDTCIGQISVLVIAKNGATELDSLEVRRQLLAVLKYNGYIKTQS